METTANRLSWWLWLKLEVNSKWYQTGNLKKKKRTFVIPCGKIGSPDRLKSHSKVISLPDHTEVFHTTRRLCWAIIGPLVLTGHTSAALLGLFGGTGGRRGGGGTGKIKQDRKKNLKQSWLPAFWKKKSKTHKRLKERFLIRRNRTKRANFQGSHLSQATLEQTQDKLNCLLFSVVVVGVLLLFFMLYVDWKRGLPRKFAHFVLFRPIKKRSFNLLCVLNQRKEAGTKWTLFPLRGRSALTGRSHSKDQRFVLKYIAITHEITRTVLLSLLWVFCFVLFCFFVCLFFCAV